MEHYSVRDLSFRYPGQKEYALSNIDLNISQGEFIVICGASGCGKSTLLRQLKTSLRPHGDISGEVFFSGERLEEVPLLVQSGNIGFVLQSPDGQSVSEMVRKELVFGAESLGIQPEEIKKRLAETVSYFGIEDLLERNISELSGGQKQTVNLAAVMLTQPQAVILDEPLSQLDPLAAGDLIRLLERINRELGITVIMSEHRLEEVFYPATRLILMKKGRIAADEKRDSFPSALLREDRALLRSLPAAVSLGILLEGEKNDTCMTTADARKLVSACLRGRSPLSVKKRDISYCSEDTPALSMKDVYFRYSKEGRDILRNTELRAYKGEVLSIVGGNGAGKTTLLMTICGILRPYSGRIEFNGKKLSRKEEAPAAFLPQDPTLLFSHETLRRQLEELSGGAVTADGPVSLCGLGELLDRHPYDLSGGEQQKAAIAGLLYCRSEIMLLDEPVKGLDRASVAAIGRLLRRLAQEGMCIIVVSHDMDFCAEYSDRCMMLFDGEITGADEVHEFFTEGRFFTTGAARIAHGLTEPAVTVNEILYSLSKPQPEDKNENTAPMAEIRSKTAESPQRPKIPVRKSRIIASISFLILFISAVTAVTVQDAAVKTGALIILVLSGFAAVISDRDGRRLTLQHRRRSMRRIVISLIPVFVLVPLTVYAGFRFFHDTKYLFISLLIILECMGAFVWSFERRHIRTRELVVIAVMCSLCVAGRAAFYMFPEFKPLTAIVIISGAALGAESGFLIGAMSMLVSNVFFSHGPWTPWQMFAMGLVGFLAGLFFAGKSAVCTRMKLSVFGFAAAVLIYGGIMDPAAMLMSHIEPTAEHLIAYYLSGLPLDLIHGISTALFLFFGAEPVFHKLERAKNKYGLVCIDG